jgi:hypothetical protein
MCSLKLRSPPRKIVGPLNWTKMDITFARKEKTVSCPPEDSDPNKVAQPLLPWPGKTVCRRGSNLVTVKIPPPSMASELE